MWKEWNLLFNIERSISECVEVPGPFEPLRFVGHLFATKENVKTAPLLAKI